IAHNDKFGDYGGTLIMIHQLQTIRFHILYGHLSRQSISTLQAGIYLSRGEQLAALGQPFENGNWPPHLHFQIIEDIGAWEGDYPGVCSLAEQTKYLDNSPDPDCILSLNKFVSL
ncbi:MAG: peptidoglycan DD-metalloendopeptidase family protein, partial [Ginsengibacter sp.]